MDSALHAAMGPRPGAAIVVDIASGNVMAQHRLDIAASRLAAPGSAIKPFTLLALLHSGRFDPLNRVQCRRQLTVAGHRMDCTHPESPLPLDAADALAYSCNSYFAAAVSLLSQTDLRHEFEKAGLISDTGLAAHEAIGRMSRPGSREQLQLQALGASGIEVTPLALVRAYRLLALQRKNNRDPALKIVYQGLEASTTYGMAHAARPDSYAVAGKTGTASSLTSPLTHGWFVGYAPAQDPKIVLLVYLEHGHGMDAAMIAHTVFTAYRDAEGKH